MPLENTGPRKVEINISWDNVRDALEQKLFQVGYLHGKDILSGITLDGKELPKGVMPFSFTVEKESQVEVINHN